jgi:hypothetical protein
VRGVYTHCVNVKWDEELNIAKAACTSQIPPPFMLLPYTVFGNFFFCSSIEMETMSLLSLLERNVHYKLIIKPLSVVVLF